jgi:SIR2-like domain
MNEIILLGAGASVDAEIPDAYDMTNTILNKFKIFRKNMFTLSSYEKVSNFVIGGLLFQKGIKGYNPLETKVDIEEFFNAILLLAERDSTELAPFVGSWHSIIEGLDRIQPFSWNSRRFIDEICDGFRSPKRLPSGSRLESSFRKAIEATQYKPGRGRIFHQLSEIMISMLYNLVWLESPESVAYLKPLMYKAKKDKLIIATLNYDNTIELAAESEKIPCNTFINKWIESGLITIKDDHLNLLKLHGSINWKWILDDSIKNYNLSYKKIEEVSDEEMAKGNNMPAIIFGRSKLTTEGPFLDLLRLFQYALLNSNILTIIGYSFRDDHINNYITQWINRTENFIIRIIDPGFEKSYIDYVRYLKGLREKYPDRINVISETTQNGLLLLYNDQ